MASDFGRDFERRPDGKVILRFFAAGASAADVVDFLEGIARLGRRSKSLNEKDVVHSAIKLIVMLFDAVNRSNDQTIVGRNLVWKHLAETLTSPEGSLLAKTMRKIKSARNTKYC